MAGRATSPLRARLWLLGSVIVLVGLLMIWFVMCRDRTSEGYLSKARQVSLGQAREEVDDILGGVCEQMIVEPSWSRYRCRPTGVGMCSCAPSMVLMVDLSYAPSGGDGQLEVSSVHLWDAGGLSQPPASASPSGDETEDDAP